MIDERKLLDTVYEIPAPEYILFRYTLAGPVTRCFAALIDHALAIFIALLGAVALAIFTGIAFASGSDFGSGLGMFLLFVAMFSINWLYFILLEWLNRGRTVGKMALGIRVVSVDGSALDLIQVVVRNLVRVADMFPLAPISLLGQFLPSYVFGGAAAWLNARSFRRLGDMAAGTIVIREQRPSIRETQLENEERLASLAAEMHLRILPAPALAQGLNDFAQRWSRLNPARADEIAGGVEEFIRRVFAAESLACTPAELLLAAHYHLYRLKREESSGMSAVGATAAQARPGARGGL